MTKFTTLEEESRVIVLVIVLEGYFYATLLGSVQQDFMVFYHMHNVFYIYNILKHVVQYSKIILDTA